jgi:hypothetical protein
MVGTLVLFEFLDIPRDDLASLSYARYVSTFNNSLNIKDADGSPTFPIL